MRAILNYLSSYAFGTVARSRRTFTSNFRNNREIDKGFIPNGFVFAGFGDFSRDFHTLAGGRQGIIRQFRVSDDIRSEKPVVNGRKLRFYSNLLVPN